MICLLNDTIRKSFFHLSLKRSCVEHTDHTHTRHQVLTATVCDALEHSWHIAFNMRCLCTLRRHLVHVTAGQHTTQVGAWHKCIRNQIVYMQTFQSRELSNYNHTENEKWHMEWTNYSDTRSIDWLVDSIGRSRRSEWEISAYQSSSHSHNPLTQINR